MSAEKDILHAKIEELEQQLAEARQMIEAVKAGEVDAFALNKNNQHEILTLHSGDYAYRVLVENFKAGALNLAEDGMIVYTNHYFHDLLGLAYDKVIGAQIEDFIHPSSRETFESLFKKGLATQSKGEIDLKSGEKVIPVYISLTSLYPYLHTVGMIVTDLTEKKTAEKHFALLFNVSPVAKSISRLSDGQVRDVNPAWEKLFGINRNDVLGKNSKELNFSTEKQRQERTEQLSKSNGHLHGFDMEFSLPGNRKLYTYTSTVNLELDGEQYMLTAYFDITDRKKAEQEIINASNALAEKNLELERTNTDLKSFSYIASHDLQEPLRKILTFINLTRKSDYSREVIEKYFDKISLSAERMSQLIHSVLEYSRLSKTTEDFTRVDLNKVLNDVKSDFEILLEEKNAVITSDKLPVVKAISLQMQQLFANLISNSLKFSKGRPQIKIHSEVVDATDIPDTNGAFKKDPPQVYNRLTFTDNGIGFEPQFREKIFEVFQQLNPKTEYEGTGIGLSTVKKIVETHNGFITASSRSGEGSEFKIWLPIAD